MHIRVSVAYLEIAQSYIPTIFNGYVSHLAVDNKNRISAVENKIRHAARYGVTAGMKSFGSTVI